MALSSVDIKGLWQVEVFAKRLPESFSFKELASAYRYALKPTQGAMIQNLPPNKTGNLAASINISIDRSHSAAGGIMAVVGPQRGKGWRQQGWHAHLVEAGTKPHTITASPGKVMPVFTKGGLVGFAESIEHPGSKGTYPFRRAVDSTWQDVARLTTDKMFNIMEREIAKSKQMK